MTAVDVLALSIALSILFLIATAKGDHNAE